MHVEGFLHKMLSPVMHKKRLDTLIVVVEGLLTWKKLSVTELGRGMKLAIQERSAIRRADRLVGNQKLSGESYQIYQKNSELLIGAKKRPKVAVDWSHNPNTKYHVLRAALITHGRTLTLYEEVHPEKRLGNVKVESLFLERLKRLLPEGCEPIIITDAGFRNPWFKKVVELGWDYVGRIRGTHQYHNGRKWLKCKDLLLRATSKAQCIGKVTLCKRNSIASNLFLLKERSKKKSSKPQHAKTKGGGKDALGYSRSAKEGWVLASSMPGKNELAVKRVIKIYKMRMQIEEGFRDLKSSQYAFGLEKAHSKKIGRIKILLLVAMIATLIAWLIGYAAEMKEWHYQFQVNSIKKRRILSLFYLGCQVFRQGLKITTEMIERAIYELWRTT